jgi:N-acyl homoserine lactone hydrolase
MTTPTATITTLDCGSISTDYNGFIEGHSGPLSVPVPAYLIQHSDGALLFDTGMHTSLMSSPDRLGPLAPAFDVQLHEEQLIGSRLRAHGLDPTSLHAVVLSHLHFDHAGGVEQLTGARFVLQRPEWEASFEQFNRDLHLYVAGDVPPDDDRLILLDGEHDVFGDGSVRCLPTFGHTAGHQSLLVETADGPLALIGDACYLRQQLTVDLPAPFAFDKAAQLAGFARFRDLEADGVRLVFSHDPEEYVA